MFKTNITEMPCIKYPITCGTMTDFSMASFVVFSGKFSPAFEQHNAWSTTNVVTNLNFINLNCRKKSPVCNP